MQEVQIEIITEVELCKDIAWYLRGQVDLAKKEDIHLHFDTTHVKALEDLIYFAQRNYKSSIPKDTLRGNSNE